MPQIPRAQNISVAYPTELTRLPKEIVTDGPDEAMARLGEKLSGIGQEWTKQINDAQQAAYLSAMHSDASLKLNDLRNQYLSTTDLDKNPAAGLFNTSPDAALAQYKDQVSKMGSDYLGQIQDPRVKAMFQANFSSLATSHTVQFSNDVKAKQVDILKGTLDQSRIKLTNAAAGAPDEQTFHDNMSALYQNINGAVAMGAISYDSAVKMREEATRTALVARAHNGLVSDPAGLALQIQSGQGIWADLPQLDRASLLHTANIQAEHRKVLAEKAASDLEAQKTADANEYAKRWIFSSFNLGDPKAGNVEGAMQFVQDPAKAATIGLVSDEQRAKVAGSIHTDWAHVNQQEELRRKTYINQANTDLLAKFNQGALDTSSIANYKLPDGSPLDPAWQEHWSKQIAAQASGSDKTDPAVYNQLIRDIYEPGKITSERRIVAMAGQGISGKEIPKLIADWQQAQDPTRSKYFNMAVDEFKRTFPDDKAKTDEFAMVLNNELRKDSNKEITGDGIYKKALELMQPLKDRTWSEWWNQSLIKQWTPFTGDTTDMSYNWQRNRAAWLNPPSPTTPAPVEASQEAPKTVTSKITRPVPIDTGAQQTDPAPALAPVSAESRAAFDAIPVTSRARIVDLLNRNGQPVTDANIKYLYDTYKDKLGL